MPTLSRTDVEVRDAGRSDLPAVRRVLLGAFQEYAEALPPAVFGRYLTDILDVEGRPGPDGCWWRCVPVGSWGTVTFHAAALALPERLGFRRAPAYDFDATRHLGLAGVRPVPILSYRLDLTEHHHPRHQEQAMHTPSINIGALYENPATGERGVVRVAPQEANGHLLVVDLYLRPGGAVAGEHVHPAATEAFTVVRGRLAVRQAGRELQAGPGTRIEVRPGVAHDFWNATAEEVRLLVEVRPGERVEQLIRQLFLAAQDGRTDARGRPRPLHAAVLAKEFGDTIRFTRSPRLVQRALFGLLAPVARAAGRRALDPEYLNRELPIVDPEPLPDELAGRIPGLAGQRTRSA